MKLRLIVATVVGLVANMLSLRAQEIDAARDLIENERYTSAEKILEKYSTKDAGDPEINYLLVKTYLEQDKGNEAKEFAEGHLRLNMTEPFTRIAYARYLLSKGNKNEALSICSSILAERKNQKDPSLLMAMAEINIDEHNGDALMAITWLDMASKRDKNNPVIDILKGMAYRKINDASNAFIAFQQALKKDPANVKANYLMGKIFYTQKNPEVYMPYFEKAYKLDSTFAPVLEDLYNHYYYRDTRLAKKFLLKFIANTDHTVQNDYYLTDILYLNAEYDKAISLANKIIQSQGDNSQLRLYKLIAYSYAKAGDSAKARENIHTYFIKEDPSKFIAADFEFRAELARFFPGAGKEAIGYYQIALEIDTVVNNRVKYAREIAKLAMSLEDYTTQALWLGKLYHWYDKSNNIDLFNWGLAHYTAKEYNQTDSVFALYTNRYPEDIYGYYWRAQANAAIDTSMLAGSAIPFYNKVVEIGELKKEVHRKMLLKAYGYLGGYEANITKNYPHSLSWFEKYGDLDPDNEDVKRYVEMLDKWITGKK